MYHAARESVSDQAYRQLLVSSIKARLLACERLD